MSNNAQTVTQLGYVGLGVSDLDGWREYAESVLGIQNNGEGPNGDVLLRMDGHHYRFILRESAADDLIFVGWQVRDGAVLDLMASRLNDFGIAVTRGTAEDRANRMVRDLIKFTDPDGVETEIYYGPLLDHRPFISPRGVPGFVADALGLGHIVLTVSDVERYTRYLDVLGARVSDHIAIPIGPMTLNINFFHVNPRHHSIAILTPPPMPSGMPDKMKRLQHFMIEATSLDAVGEALDLYKQRGMAYGDLGRHSNDRMLSFYGNTPAGFHVEYGFGGLLIENEDDWVVQTWNSPDLWGHGMPTDRSGEMQHIG